MATKKEMKEEYKQMKPDMGVFCIRTAKENRCLIFAVQDLKSRLNRLRFQLELGSYPGKELQEDWKRLGAENFVLEILEELEYSRDETKTDYSEDLEILRLDWEERLSAKGYRFYD
jgi:hypothetical protein